MSGLIHFQSLLHATVIEAEKFCFEMNIQPFKVRVESSQVIVPTEMKTVSNRAELEFYFDANDVLRVGKAVIYHNGKVLTTVTTDECDECGGSCDGVHANVFSVHALLNMTQEEVKKYCASNNVVHYTVYADPTYIGTPYNVQTVSPNRVEIRLRNHVENGKNVYRVFSADYYRDNLVVNSLKGDYLAPSTAKIDSAQEKRIQPIVDAILKNGPDVIDEVVRQMKVKRVNDIVEILSKQTPEDVDAILTRVCTAKKSYTRSEQSDKTIEELRQRWKNGY